MGTSYRAQIAVAFEVLAEGLAPFVDQQMTATFPGADWIMVAASKLGKRRDVIVSLSDPHFQLEVLNRWWGPAFSPPLTERERQTVGELRTARNYWAHPDEDHPFDHDYASAVIRHAEELLRAIDSPQAARMSDLQDQLQWDGVQETAREQGLTESEALIHQLTQLREEQNGLEDQLRVAREEAQSASGRTRAVTRQLAELQTQYAAVAGLRDQYLVLQKQLEEERAKREAVLDDTTSVREQLDSATSAIENLQVQSNALSDQLNDARRNLSDVDPLQTAAGRRWVWLITSLVLVLGLLVVVAYWVGYAATGKG
ncbi:MAG TPA: Swt1 family HEPN domain-containing protein [Acidimicrobiales bacterium]